MPSSSLRRLNRLMQVTAAVVVMWLFLGVSSGSAENITIFSDTMGIVGDRDPDPDMFNGVPFRAVVEDGIAYFYFAGDLIVGTTDTVTLIGSRPISLVVGGDAVFNAGALINASGFGTTPGCGGGAGGAAGEGGSGGAGVWPSPPQYAWGGPGGTGIDY
ncbi:MAG TPA: hypothetical protein PKH07_01995, partial [bacterium]|nr:hypothetical protein [bacterium]